MFETGLLGAGAVAQFFANEFIASKRARIAAIYAPDASVSTYSEVIGARPASAPDDIFNDQSVKIVIIGSPVNTRADYFSQAMKAGKHIFCASPVANSEENARFVEAAATNCNQVVWADLALRSMPEFQYLREQISANAIGQIGTIRISSCFPSMQSVSGAMPALPLDIVSQLFDVLEWCFGPVQRISAFAAEPAAEGKMRYALIVVRMKSGAIAHLEASRAEPDTVSYITYEITGQSGLLEFDSRIERTLTVGPKNEGETCPLWDAGEGHTGQVKMFLDAVERNEHNCSTVLPAVRASRLALLAAQSTTSNEPINV